MGPCLTYFCPVGLSGVPGTLKRPGRPWWRLLFLWTLICLLVQAEQRPLLLPSRLAQPPQTLPSSSDPHRPHALQLRSAQAICWLLRAAERGPPQRLWRREGRLKGSQPWVAEGHGAGAAAAAAATSTTCCVGETCMRGEEDSQGAAEQLKGVTVFLPAEMAASEVWGLLPRLLRGPAAYEATAVRRLKAAGASLRFPFVPNSSNSSSSSSKSSSISSNNSSGGLPSLTSAVHLVFSPFVTWRFDAPAASAAAAAAAACDGSSGSLAGAASSNTEEPPQLQELLLKPRLAFCPSRGSVSCFGCFTAASGLLDGGSRLAHSAAIEGLPSPLRQASWCPPALWLCGTEALLLRGSFEVLKGVDLRDLRTVHFEQQRQQQLQQHLHRQQQASGRSSVRFGVLRVADSQILGGPPSLLLRKRQQMLAKLQQQQQQNEQPVVEGPLCSLTAETLQRAVVAASLLQCCEVAGLLLRVGGGAFASEPPVFLSGEQTHQQQQQEQQHQHRRQLNFWERVCSERTEGLSPTWKRRILLGGTLLRDPRKTLFVKSARAAQEALLQQLQTFFQQADVLVHAAEDSAQCGTPKTASSQKQADGDVSELSSTELPIDGPKLALSSLREDFRKTLLEGCGSQLLAAAAAAGYPSFASSEGWMLLGSPGSDAVLLDVAARLCVKWPQLESGLERQAGKACGAFWRGPLPARSW
ncbi:hypothetical protein Efla_005591 [Eimeria flavescens]